MKFRMVFGAITLSWSTFTCREIKQRPCRHRANVDRITELRDDVAKSSRVPESRRFLWNFTTKTRRRWISLIRVSRHNNSWYRMKILSKTKTKQSITYIRFFYGLIRDDIHSLFFTPIFFSLLLDSSKTFSLDYCNGVSNAISSDRYRNGIEHNSQYVSRANRK